MKFSESQKVAAVAAHRAAHHARIDRDVQLIALGFVGGAGFTFLVFVVLLAMGY